MNVVGNLCIVNIDDVFFENINVIQETVDLFFTTFKNKVVGVEDHVFFNAFLKTSFYGKVYHLAMQFLLLQCVFGCISTWQKSSYFKIFNDRKNYKINLATPPFCIKEILFLQQMQHSIMNSLFVLIT